MRANWCDEALVKSLIQKDPSVSFRDEVRDAIEYFELLKFLSSEWKIAPSLGSL
jgi:hypothetical protein